jgi:hypothetical protein
MAMSRRYLGLTGNLSRIVLNRSTRMARSEAAICTIVRVGGRLHPLGSFNRWSGGGKEAVMAEDEIEDIRLRMEAAAGAMDFEEATRLRDQLNLIRGGASRSEAEHADTRGLNRQAPGAMGLGTSQQRVTPPTGWKAPPKPDPLTASRSRRTGHRPRSG